MSLRASIHACLLSDTRVTDLIGNGDGFRHYPERARQGVAAPYLVSNEIAGDALTSHGRPGDPEDTMDETLVQFTAVAETVAQAVALRTAVRAAILEDVGGVLAAAKIVATAPVTRFATVDQVEQHGAQLDITFFHNPNT